MEIELIALLISEPVPLPIVRNATNTITDTTITKIDATKKIPNFLKSALFNALIAVEPVTIKLSNATAAKITLPAVVMSVSYTHL